MTWPRFRSIFSTTSYAKGALYKFTFDANCISANCWDSSASLLNDFIHLKMDKQLFYVPILPSAGPGDRTGDVESVPYQAPEFWPLVNVLREVMYRYLSRNPENCDLPRPGINKKLDNQVNLFIEMKFGNKNVRIVSKMTVVMWVITLLKVCIKLNFIFPLLEHEEGSANSPPE